MLSLLQKTALLSLIVALTMSCSSDSRPASLPAALAKYSIRWTAVENFQLKNFHQNDGKEKQFTYFSGESKKALILFESVSPISEEEFSVHSQLRYALLLNSYMDRPTPYKDALTSRSQCAMDFLPIELSLQSSNGPHARLLLAFANDRHVFGVCDQESARFVGSLLVVYLAEKKTMLQIKAFWPKQDFTLGSLKEIYSSLEI